MDIVTYALCKKYVEKTAEALGAVKGAPCTIKSTETSPDGKYIIVTFSWMSNTTPSVEETTQITITNGNSVEVTQILHRGTKIAEITIDGLKTDLFAPAGGGGSAVLTDDMYVTKTVGGVSSGDSYPAGTSLEDILRDMLAPVLYPTFTNPSATLSATGSKIIEVGGHLLTTMTVTFNRGSINPAYNTSGYRSGEAQQYVLNSGTPQSSNSFSVDVTEAVTSYSAVVSYAAGEQPKDSSGQDYDSPLPAGTVTTNLVNYEFVNALWASIPTSGIIKKQALVSKGAKQKVFSFPSAFDVTPETFDVPADWTVTAVEVKNDLTGAYDDCSSEFSITDTTHPDAAGNTVNYKRYTCNLGYAMDARDIRIKWS